MTEQACAAVTKRGTPCKGIVPAGARFCLVHDPARADQVAAMRRRGGTVATKLKLLQGQRQRLESARALSRFLSDVMIDTLAGRVEMDMARTLAYCASVQKGLVETAELEKQVAELERLQARRGSA